MFISPFHTNFKNIDIVMRKKIRETPTSTVWPSSLPKDSEGFSVFPNPHIAVDPREYGRSKRQQQLYQADLAAYQWESELAYNEYLRKHEEWYNSPEQQVQRMKEAGLNPDIMGGVTPGEASEISGAPTTQSVDSITRDGRVFNQIKAGFDTALNSMIGGVQTIQSLQNIFQGSQRFDLDMASSLQSMMHAADRNDLEQALSLDNFAKYDAFNFGLKNAPERFVSPRIQKRYANIYREHMASLDTLRNKAKYQEELNKTLSSGYFHLSPSQIKDVGHVAASLLELEPFVMNLSLTNEGRYQQRSQELGLPETRAGAEHSKQSYDKTKSDLMGAAASKLEEFVSAIEDSSDDNPAISYLASTVIGTPALMYAFSKIPGGKKLANRLLKAVSKKKKK